METLTDLLKKNFKVACFDMDGTLIKGTTSNLFYAKLLNVEQEVIDLEYQLKRGDINSDSFMVTVSEIMHELTVDYVKNNFELVPKVEGIHETLQYLRNANIIPIIVTTSNILFAECFKEVYGFKQVFGTVHRIYDNGTIGIGTTVCSSNHKIEHVKKVVENLGGTMNQVISIGDSFSDLPIFSKVGCSIAFNYDETLEGKASIYVKSNNIFSILDGIAQKYGVKKDY
jgi:phosphoserine phosphatase